jgi:ABC-type enterochelin transport system substrate-binding protein
LEIEDMTIKTLTFVAAITLATSIIAGGDDRDMGPVESFDSMQPVTGKTVITEQAPDTMTLSKVIGKTPSGIAVTQRAHQACQDKLGLSDSNIAIFKAALAVGSEYNTGPIDAMGTLFSPERWEDYYNCIGRFSFNAESFK